MRTRYVGCVVILTTGALLSLIAVAALTIVATQDDDGDVRQLLNLVPTSCDTPLGHAGHPSGTVDLTGEQIGNARIVVAVGQELKLPSRAWIIAVATAMQESTLRNLSYGDRDSLGLFQQRPSTGWGTPAQIMDPRYSSRAFYDALTRVDGWQSLPLTVAAQRVQRSAFPSAYARWERLATDTVRLLAGVVAATAGCRLPARGAWTTPIARGAYRLTARFGECSALWSRCHTGLDLAAPVGTTIVAASAGTVSFTGDGGAYGNLTKVKHVNGVETYYAHQSRIDVGPNQRVDAGQRIGQVGATGNVTGPHLHLEVRVDGTPRDPYTWLVQRGVRP